jgi:transcriptional regulator with XRE-family HTH domain
VAEAAGIKQPTYQALESGKTKKSAYLPEIAKFLGVDVEWLKTGNGSAPEKAMPIYLRWRLVFINLAIPFQMDM